MLKHYLTIFLASGFFTSLATAQQAGSAHTSNFIAAPNFYSVVRRLAPNATEFDHNEEVRGAISQIKASALNFYDINVTPTEKFTNDARDSLPKSFSFSTNPQIFTRVGLTQQILNNGVQSHGWKIEVHRAYKDGSHGAQIELMKIVKLVLDERHIPSSLEVLFARPGQAPQKAKIKRVVLHIQSVRDPNIYDAFLRLQGLKDGTTDEYIECASFYAPQTIDAFQKISTGEVGKIECSAAAILESPELKETVYRSATMVLNPRTNSQIILQ